MSSFYGLYGGSYVPETLLPALRELEDAFERERTNPSFQEELQELLSTYAGRPSPLFFARNASARLGVNLYLKREDLLHTGAHKINNALGQVLLAKRMGKTRIIAETGAGQHGVATATACALCGMECVVYMGALDVARQEMNVKRMELLGATVVPVKAGSNTLKDAINEAMRDYAATFKTTHYLIGSVVGPHPYPTIVEYFQSVIGREARAQSITAMGQLPDTVVACVGGGSNAIGIFSAFLDDDVTLIGVEAGGRGKRLTDHASRFSSQGRCGVLHGCRTIVLEHSDGNIADTHSIAAGLDYPAIGPHHAYLHRTRRVLYTSVRDEDALAAFHFLARTEGILPALESSHAIAYVVQHRRAPHLRGKNVVVNLSGRGDKDLHTVLSLSSHRKNTHKR